VHGSDSLERVLFELDYIQSSIQPGFGRSIRFAPWLRASTVRASLPTSVADEETSRFLPVAELERRYMLHVLRSVDGNKSKAARILGYDRRTLYRKLARLTQGEQQPSELFELSISLKNGTPTHSVDVHLDILR
jgi:DNA-binding NtrC family response regulator